MKKSILILFALLGSALAQVPVTLAPPPKLQFFDDSGRPLAFGCLFSDDSGTNTPLATYTDQTGTVANTNPIILDSGGYAGNGSSGVWLAAGQAYRLSVYSNGGTNCSLGSLLYTIDGIGGGLTLLTTVVTCNGSCPFNLLSQNQLFLVNLTADSVAQPLTAVGVLPPAYVIFQITQDSAGGHSWTWPSNSVGGCTIGSAANQITTQEFIWTGSKAYAIGPCVTGNGPQLSAGELDLTGQLVSSLITGTPPFVVASTTQVANLNVSLLEGGTWQVPGTIGSTTPNTGAFTTLAAGTSFQLAGGTVQTAMQGTDTHIQTAGTVAASAPIACTDANGGITTTGCGAGGINAPHRAELGIDTAVTANTQTTILSQSVTFPSGAGTYRADVRYGAWITAANNACAAEIIDATNSHAFALSGQDANGSGFIGLSGTEISSNTYTAGTTITFHLDVICNSTQTVTSVSGLFTLSPAEKTFFEVIPILSN